MNASTPSPPAGLRLRLAAERFHSRLDWLDSWHTFSFASHFDPQWRGFGPLRVINDDTIAAGQGFGPHPHRDMEIITVMVEGQLKHQDSMGHRTVLRAGEVQRMSAGQGIVHSEINEGKRPCRLLQVWIEPIHRGQPPSYEQKAFPREPGWTPLLDPSGGSAAMAIDGQAWLWRGRASAHQGLPAPSAPCQRVWIQLISGSLRLGWEEASGGGSNTGAMPLTLAAGDGLGWEAGVGAPPIVSVTAGPQGADLLWFAFT